VLRHRKLRCEVALKSDDQTLVVRDGQRIVE